MIENIFELLALEDSRISVGLQRTREIKNYIGVVNMAFDGKSNFSHQINIAQLLLHSQLFKNQAK